MLRLWWCPFKIQKEILPALYCSLIAPIVSAWFKPWLNLAGQYLSLLIRILEGMSYQDFIWVTCYIIHVCLLVHCFIYKTLLLVGFSTGTWRRIFNNKKGGYAPYFYGSILLRLHTSTELFKRLTSPWSIFRNKLFKISYSLNYYLQLYGNSFSLKLT